MRPELQPALDLAKLLPASEVPRLLGDLEEIKATALARLTAPPAAAPAVDELLPVPEAARRLGMSRSYLYQHASGKFKDIAKREGRKLLFSAKGIQQYISKRRS